MSRYFSFDGCNTRSQYWGITIGIFIATIILAAVGTALIATLGPLSIIGGGVLFATVVGSIWVSIANIIKRCRDCDLNPMWTVGAFVPYIGLIVYIVIGCLSTKTAQ